MGRAGKLYRRLDELEAGLRRLIVRDLERTAEGRISTEDFAYLLLKAYPDAATRAASEQCEWMLKADREIVALRTKLGEPLPGPCLGIAEAYGRLYRCASQEHSASFRSLKRAAASAKKEAARRVLHEIREKEGQA